MVTSSVLRMFQAPTRMPTRGGLAVLAVFISRAVGTIYRDSVVYATSGCQSNCSNCGGARSTNRCGGACTPKGYSCQAINYCVNGGAQCDNGGCNCPA